MTGRNPDSENGRSHQGIDWRKWSPWIIATLVVAAYANSFRGVFLFDDYACILDRADIRRLSTCLSHTTRPLADLTFYLNYKISGFRAADFHLVNLAVHLVAGLLLFGLIRRTLWLPALVSRFRTDPTLMALAVAALWTTHPLQTESVTYIVQRSESLMGLFYLLTVYCAARGFQASEPRPWFVMAIAACMLGMLVKPVMVTAPIMVLLYDRAFNSGSFRQALRDRLWFYGGLAIAWIPLLPLLLAPNESSTSTGVGAGMISPLKYLAVQQGVVAHYLRLSVWPYPLCLDYDWPSDVGLVGGVISGVTLILLVMMTVWATAKRRPLGFAGIWFFVILAPTSSVVPIADYAVEHRMYLPLVSVSILVSMAVWRMVGAAGNRLSWCGATQKMLFPAVVLVIAVGFASLTARRNRDYHSELGMWTDILTVRPDNLRARFGVGSAMLRQGEYRSAGAHFGNILRKISLIDGQPPEELRTLYVLTQTNLGTLREREGKYREAARCFEEALRVSPGFADAQRNLDIVTMKIRVP